MSKKKNKKSTLPKNWKTQVLYNAQSEEACFELTKDDAGYVLEPIFHKGVNDWVASVTLIEGAPMGLEDMKVGDTIGYAINNKLWF